MSSFTLKQIFEDEKILRSCVEQCMIHDKHNRFKRILSKYSGVKHCHKRYFRILVNTFDNLNQNDLVCYILKKYENGNVNAEQKRLIKIYKIGRSLFKLIPRANLIEDLPLCLYPEFVISSIKTDDKPIDNIVHFQIVNLETNNENQKPHYLNKNKSSLEHNNFESVHIDMDKNSSEIVIKDSKFVKQPPQIEEHISVVQKNYDNLQMPTETFTNRVFKNKFIKAEERRKVENN